MSEMDYQETRYRSRLEVAWIIVLRTLDIPYAYEPESFRLPGGLYVPDVWLADAQRYLEIKPRAPLPAALAKAQALAARTGYPVFFLCGFPQLSGLTLMNSDCYWQDGSRVGPGMPVASKVLYVLGREETPETIERLALAVSHATNIVHAPPHTLTRLEPILTGVCTTQRIPWPPIREQQTTRYDMAALVRQGMNEERTAHGYHPLP